MSSAAQKDNTHRARGRKEKNILPDVATAPPPQCYCFRARQTDTLVSEQSSRRRVLRGKANNRIVLYDRLTSLDEPLEALCPGGASRSMTSLSVFVAAASRNRASTTLSCALRRMTEPATA